MSNSLPSIPFQFYNNYYDLLYSKKDYAKEADYVARLIKQINPKAKNLIELGSGTGNYSKHFCRLGFKVTGIERSEQMTEVAKSKSIEGFLPLVDDIISFKLPQKFDAAVSLFHVISYLTDNEDIISCFKQICSHLNTGGLFIFDVWYTPAVYSQRPEKRTKLIENDKVKIRRTAQPTVIHQRNIVKVDYEMLIEQKHDEQLQVLKESHLMRHFSTPEIELFASVSGFVLLKSEEFLTAKEPGADTWGVCYVLQKHD